MTAQLAPDQIFRIITDYEALQDGFLDRIDDLNTTMEQVELAGGLTARHAQKLLMKSPGKPRKDRPSTTKRIFGWESLGKMLKGTGLALALIVDDARFAPIKASLARRRRKDKPRIAGSPRPAWLFTKDKAREMGKKRWSDMSEAEQKRHQRKAAKALGRIRRKNMRERLKERVQKSKLPATQV